MPPHVFDTTNKYLLWVGNSLFYYNNGISSHVRELARADNPSSTYRGTAVTISGSGLDWHDVGSYFRPNAIGRYAFTENNTVSFDTGHQHFDALVMVDSTQGPIHPELRSSFHGSVAAHCNTARRNGAEPVLFMSWAYVDRPEMTEQLCEQYSIAAKANGAHLIPAGLAFANAMSQSDIKLHELDGRHPTLAGTYLAACTSYASIFGRSPVGLGYTAGLDAEQSSMLQDIAHATVSGFLQPV